ncbi:MAG: hypothetical protein MUF71_09210 [Candidatus Kapabacteria bacterium]|jgi:hypothetical protein|nr:hypothetical protein [Candidatus Kapabacteria bacterium]
MKSILFVAHDPGGANVIKPVIEYYAARHDLQSHLLLLGPAAERIKPTSTSVVAHTVRTITTPDFPNELSAEPEDIAGILDKIKPQAVFTATSFNSNLERLAVRFANERGIPTFSILDFWSNYQKRFTLNGTVSQPQTLFVADGRMKREAEAELPGTSVLISGNPHLANIAAQYADARSKAVTTPIRRIRFFCENIKHYYPEKPINEFTVVPRLLQSLRLCGFNGELIIRPHPMESREPWQEAVQRDEGEGMRDIDEENNIRKRVTMRLDTASFDEVLRDNCLAVGFSSMALLETASVGIPTFSYQISVPDDYFWLPFEEYGIVCLREEADIMRLLEEQAHRDIRPISADNHSPLTVIDQAVRRVLS